MSGRNCEPLIAASLRSSNVGAGVVGRPADGDHTTHRGGELNFQDAVGEHAPQKDAQAAGIGDHVAVEFEVVLDGPGSGRRKEPISRLRAPGPLLLRRGYSAARFRNAPKGLVAGTAA